MLEDVGARSSARLAARRRRPGQAAPPRAAAATAAAHAAAIAVERVVPPAAGARSRVRRRAGSAQHPYVRLALNPARSRRCGSGQVISLFGDRVNQLALAAFVFEIDGLAARRSP